uniref:Uncharacterized protein n=1 Tax=Lactuca sativa TaxID=4236 RepID=A0A9R1VKG1_LACSA|nr:hypothetical protein LSAT_V11C500264750 [Lactuca sativa]
MENEKVKMKYVNSFKSTSLASSPALDHDQKSKNIQEEITELKQTKQNKTKQNKNTNLMLSPQLPLQWLTPEVRLYFTSGEVLLQH